MNFHPEISHGSLVLSQSEWLNIINGLGFDRFELIAIRIPVKESHLHTPFKEALAKIRQAEDNYKRGNWNGVAASCRVAWKTILSVSPQGDKAIEHLLAPAIGDPMRKQFALAVKRFLDVLNKGVHLEGDVKGNEPPSELQPEDALLCLHPYTVVTAYLSLIYKQSDLP